MRIRHGGELRVFSEKFGIPEREILDFSSNINPWGLPSSVKEAYGACAEELSYFPDAEALEFRREVARYFPLWPENVVAGNGAMELLDLILRFLRPKKALLVEPAFLEYRRLLNLNGAEIRSVNLKEKESFQFSLPELINALQGVEVAILAQPNNPTGTLPAAEMWQKILAEAKRRDIFIIVDEAFIDWVPDRSLAKEVRDDSYFFVVRSLTKFYTLPGIRIGYGLGSKKLIERLATHQVPWSCNRIAQKLGIAALRDTSFAAESREWLAEERTWLTARLGEFPWLKVYPSLANFLLIRGAAPLFEEMGRQGVYIRDLTEFPGLGSTYFRISVRRREENERLIAALRNCRIESTARVGGI